MSETGFKARDFGLRAQKKILGRMANKNVAKMFIDDTTAGLLDSLYQMIKLFCGSKKEAENIVKNIIKIVIKIGILYRNGQFDNEEALWAVHFKKRFRSAAMAIISFHEVDFSYDRPYLLTAIKESQAALRCLVQNHLTDKSLSRIDLVYNFFLNPAFFDAIFKRHSDFSPLLARFVTDLNRSLDEGGM
ncbi:tumor necrosis factor alpha-induced protein 8-like protein isoform X2 [Nilaparvata lugens]|uniref:tumor necrosis factor alpha-induced protein 8-like protein isoform X1 n=1 Tax=Nilaparvata lugens TaxID=108931 RepID=UPI000B992C57|nr:tumor necrosis factor alpha-induced protein 8-like protein isoform X1 [Nilaparvata lugens]XP_039291324.1 tumor necrosis factor alpha-induced protein 8-like protein isoform X1 [Nilaparvata lugens]XP_039291325.1 tumor necrosis factor alpha-induced protein 8-like protein isoform X2 [Nilaparvata lugens]